MGPCEEGPRKPARLRDMIVWIAVVAAVVALLRLADSVGAAAAKGRRIWRAVRHRVAMAIVDFGAWLDRDDEIRAIEEVLRRDADRGAARSPEDYTWRY